MYNYIIFDVDGTMIDTEGVVLKSYQEIAFEEFGRRLSEDELSALYGVPSRPSLERLGMKDLDKAYRRYFEILSGYFAQGAELFDGISELLEELGKLNIPCAIVTSRNGDEVAKDITLQKLLPYFEIIISADDTTKHKPHPEPILKVIELSGKDASKMLYVGDTLYDCMCANGAGVSFALASWGAKQPEGIKADHVLGNPSDLLALVSK